MSERHTTPSGIVVEFRQHDWLPGFAAYLFEEGKPFPNGQAFCAINLDAFLGSHAIAGGAPAELAESLADTMVHEVCHVIEHWAGVEFSEARVDGLIARYRGHASVYGDEAYRGMDFSAALYLVRTEGGAHPAEVVARRALRADEGWPGIRVPGRRGRRPMGRPERGHAGQRLGSGDMTDPREIRAAMLSDLLDGPIHTMDRLRNRAVEEVLEVRRERLRTEGNRRARRKAAAQARKVITATASDPMDPPPPWLSEGEAWLRQHVDMCRHPSRYMA